MHLQCHLSTIKTPKSSKAFQDNLSRSSKRLQPGQGRTLLKKSEGLGVPRKAQGPLILISKYYRWNGTQDDGSQHFPVIMVMIKMHHGKYILPKKLESSLPVAPQLKRWERTHVPQHSGLTCLLVLELFQILVSPFSCGSRTTVPLGMYLLCTAFSLALGVMTRL